ncbi:hypothetical protein EYR40_003136 [Pleurotus pulmonarius]|nr:hypothetical protein EYR40_003136 [Pleurotus pulmonarius]
MTNGKLHNSKQTPSELGYIIADKPHTLTTNHQATIITPPVSSTQRGRRALTLANVMVCSSLSVPHYHSGGSGIVPTRQGLSSIGGNFERRPSDELGMATRSLNSIRLVPCRASFTSHLDELNAGPRLGNPPNLARGNVARSMIGAQST